MNVELLRKIAAVIQEKPEKFDMESYAGESNCGSTFCIAGWAHVLTGGKAREASLQKGRIALGLDRDSAPRLFWCDLWPDQFREGKSGWQISPATAAARIEHFIETGGAE